MSPGEGSHAALRNANGLALDVQRYLADEAISARPPSKIYKLQKTVLRNKLLFTGAGVILAPGRQPIIVSAALAKEAITGQDQQVTRFLEDMLNGAGPSAARGQDTTMLQEILDQTAERIGRSCLISRRSKPSCARSSALYEQIGRMLSRRDGTRSAAIRR
jgi:hypothetical protein